MRKVSPMQENAHGSSLFRLIFSRNQFHPDGFPNLWEGSSPGH